MEIKPEDILEDIKFSNFAQAFKMLVWSKIQGSFLSEESLDEIAKEIWGKWEIKTAPLSR